jgi:hypothetical protein
MNPSEFGRRPPTGGGHGGGVRGAESVGKSPLFAGRFGRMFQGLPGAEWPREALLALGAAMTSKPEVDDKDPSLPAAALEDTNKRLHDDEENAGIPAGYTYLGQFIDHDITFDPASSLQKLNDPDGLVDFRTPQLDLDSLYGRGPDDQPYMYSGKKFRLGGTLLELDRPTKSRDLPRYTPDNPDDPEDSKSARRALIGDKRNDENVIVSQLHGAMLQFHNKLVDADPDASFAEIQKLVRWHYQWVVVNDFLVKICGRSVIHDILPHLGKNEPIWRNEPRFSFYHWRNDPYMPIEFAAAAYRFGHSMVRPIYRLNTRLNGGDNPLSATPDEERRGLAGRFFIFAGVQRRGLNGFDAFPKQWAIDWSLYFDVDGSGESVGKHRVQPAYKIDTSLVNPLGFLPEFSEHTPDVPPLTVDKLQSKPKDPANDPANLAVRNLLRGMAVGLPCGQDVACAMGVEPVTDDNLRVGKAVVGDWSNNPTVASIHPSFKGKAPLWYYVLAETQYEWMRRATAPGGKGDAEPLRLGTVGKRIVAETLIGLLWGDKHSYLRQAPNWHPTIGGPTFGMGQLIKYALS